MKLTSVALAASLLVTSSSCATIFSPGPDRVPISSNPPGARVYVDDQLVGQTPVVIELDRKRSLGRIRLETDGYHPAILLRSKDLEGWFLVNLCLVSFFWIGMLIDLGTNNVQGFDDTPVMIHLIPAEGGVMPGTYPPPASYPPPAAPAPAAPPSAAPPTPAPAPAPAPTSPR